MRPIPADAADSSSLTVEPVERKWRTLIIVCVGIFMLLLDITVVSVALPDIQRELHSSFTDLQWVVDAYALMLATATLDAGSLGDMLGRKRVFLTEVVCSRQRRPPAARRLPLSS